MVCRELCKSLQQLMRWYAPPQHKQHYMCKYKWRASIKLLYTMDRHSANKSIIMLIVELCNCCMCNLICLFVCWELSVIITPSRLLRHHIHFIQHIHGLFVIVHSRCGFGYVGCLTRSLQGITDNTHTTRDRVGVTAAATASNPYYATSWDVLIIAPTTLYHHRVV